MDNGIGKWTIGFGILYCTRPTGHQWKFETIRPLQQSMRKCKKMVQTVKTEHFTGLNINERTAIMFFVGFNCLSLKILSSVLLTEADFVF